MYREAVRQRKALSRTSSNILLNSVHLQNQPYNYTPTNNRMKFNVPRHSDCDEPNLIIKESQQECYSEISELEVIDLIISRVITFIVTLESRERYIIHEQFRVV